MTIESNSPNTNNNNKNNNKSSGGAAMATEESASASTFFRHPGGEIIREGHGNNSDALASRLELMEMQMEMLLQKSTSDGGDRTEEHIDLIRKGSSNDDEKPHGDDDDKNVPADTNSKSVEEFKLPRSAYTLLITTDICSLPFNTGIVALGFALICLISVLTHRIALINDPKNPFGMAVGVNAEVSVAKYVAVTIAVLMENEIPTGLELIGKGAQQVLLPDGSRKFSMKRIVFSSLIRLTVGFLFLSVAFLNMIQQEAVLSIFYGLLGLLFVEKIDDVVFFVAQQGFFGRRLEKATNKLPTMEISSVATQEYNFAKWSKRCVRLVYFLNLCVGYACLTYVATRQANGQYRCSSFMVRFGDEIWEGAHINNGGEKMEDRLLIYSHFNGIYVEDGTHDGRPRYVERNKENWGAFKQEVIPAEIVYCGMIGMWVFRHQHIRTSLDSDSENPCSWLMKSQGTISFDITSVSTWYAWTGAVETQPASVSIKCTECRGEGSCSYNGQCVEDKCECQKNFYGTACQYSKPCNVIRSEKDYNTSLELLPRSSVDNGEFFESYGRPIYVIRNMTGKPYSLLRFGYYPEVGEEYFEIEYAAGEGEEADLPMHKHKGESTYYLDDDFFEQNVIKEKLDKNYTFALQYTGRRWYGGLFSSGFIEDVFKEGRYHGFWDNVFSNFGVEDNSTFLISAPTFGGSPTGINFYEMRRRNVADSSMYKHDYDPFGVLIPLSGYEGSGFFHCNADAEV